MRLKTTLKPSFREIRLVFTLLATSLFAANLTLAAEADEDDGVTRYVRFTDATGTHNGILEGQSIRVLDGDPIFDDEVNSTDRTVSLDNVELEIPINPDRVPHVLGVAGNSNNPDGNPIEVEHPSWFGKATTSLAKNGAQVEVPFGATNFNFEGELALIIGREGRHIAESEAMDYLFGVAVGNDWSENDWCGERRGIEEPSHVFCKAGDTFATLGDQVVTGLDLSDLELTVHLNGMLAAQGTTADFRNDPAALISKLSHYITLKRGDIIYTGTVAPPQLPGTRRQLWQDDILEVEIEGIGKVSNQLARVTRNTMSGPEISAANGSYVRFSHAEGHSFGLLEGNEVQELDGDPIGNSVDFTGRTFDLGEVELSIPVDVEKPGRKILAAAANYHPTDAPPRQVPHPRYFLKHSSGLSGDGDNVERPPEVELFIPEGELVLIIGREGRHIPTDQAHEYIFGVAAGNDWSELAWITAGPGTRPLKLVGKATDTWSGLGSTIVRGMDFSDIEITTQVNGELLSQGQTSTMINNPARLVSYLSRYMTLKPGDMIYTGAISPLPGMRQNLDVGDVVEVTVEGLGSFEQEVITMPDWPYGS
ncbi:MAG: fumarylacetoacetate hydrolase family protein [Gammaproteobacteria bacterium]|nr:fumarylacetoacetate hydrolase family protein [Gammaproteobacteria bacterium]